MMLHAYASEVWRLYGIPFDRLGGLWFDDFELMAIRIDQDIARARRQEASGERS